MAHSKHTKARALALLVLQEPVTRVARQLGIPKQTVSDWKRDNIPALERRFFGELANSPAMQELLQVFRFIKKP